MHWCCHARFVLSSAFSDGTVPFSLLNKLQQRAEEITRQQGIRGVTTINIVNAFVDLDRGTPYRALEENPPKAKELSMSHAAACLLCSPDFARECEAQVDKEFKLVDTVKKHLKGRMLWCAHTVQSLAEIMIDRKNGEETIGRIIPFAEKVSAEKNHPGVITRDLFIALGRMAA
jgi:hypothetical protein